MKKFYLFVLSLNFVSITLFAQLANGSFENWTAVPYFDNPDNWSTSNGAYSTTVGTVTKWGIPQEGKFAVSIESKEIAGKVIPGIIATGKVDTSNLNVSGGQPVSGRPGKLTGFYHYTPAAGSGDLASFEILLSKWNQVKAMRDTVAYGQYSGAEFNTATDYKAFEILLNYNSTILADPDTQLIIISSGKDRLNAKAGSALWVDNLALETLVTGLNSSEGTSGFLSFPNPAVNELTFRTNEKAKLVYVFDMLGKKTDELIVKNNETSLNTRSYSPGIYYYLILSDNNSVLYTNKFVIK